MLVMDIINETLEMLRKPIVTRPGLKQCTLCKVEKPVSEFHKNKRNITGYHVECKECCKERISKWQKENPDKMRAIWNRDKRRRRKSILSSAPYLLPSEWDRLKQQFNNRCAYCGCDNELFQDHVIPIARDNGGGAIVPACEKCNSSKGDTDFEQWYIDQDFFSQGRYNKVIQCLK